MVKGVTLRLKRVSDIRGSNAMYYLYELPAMTNVCAIQVGMLHVAMLLHTTDNDYICFFVCGVNIGTM
jgi:hypothetical protein